MSNLKLQKLTENLKKSIVFRTKMEQQVEHVGEAILQTRLQMARLEQHIQRLTKQSAQMDCNLKKYQQQHSAYEYKMQKIEIRKEEYLRKVQIQQNMLDKKNSHQFNLRKRMNELENQLKAKHDLKSEIQHSKQAIEIITQKINNQNIQIEQLCSTLLLLNKKTRAKEDEVQRKVKLMEKKKAQLIKFNSQIQNDANKENQTIHNQREKTTLNTLTNKKQQINQQLQKDIHTMLQIHQALQTINDNGVGIRKNIQKSEEIVKQCKMKKQSLIRLQEMLQQEKGITQAM